MCTNRDFSFLCFVVPVYCCLINVLFKVLFKYLLRGSILINLYFSLSSLQNYLCMYIDFCYLNPYACK